MLIDCPKCGSKRFRFYPRKRWTDRLLRGLGWYRFQCQDCEARFRQHVLMPQRWIYAKCPRCYRLDLSSWDLKHYRVSLSVRIMLALGAERMRCEKCRCNFASFRLRKQWYRRRKMEAADGGPEQTVETA